MQRAGLWLLRYGRRIVELRSGVREAGSLKAFDAEFRMHLPVLLYHHIGPSRPQTFPEWTVSVERFEGHVRWLSRRGYTGICPSDWLRWLREGKGLPRKPVLLTFDDGFADLAQYALPVLRRYGFGAGVFIVTGQVGGTNAWDEARGSGTHRVLTSEQIRYWATQQIEFGAHTRTHADLTALSTPELSAEITGSGKDLESILGIRPRTFAYPYGLHNQATDDCVRKSFEMAFLGDGAEGLNNLSTDPFQTRRIVVKTTDSALDVECRVRWGFNPIERVREPFRLRSRLRSLWGRH
jgi:peptidoglycan/xylan/chitin deacetylase (PgdA/CDA1 family)